MCVQQRKKKKMNRHNNVCDFDNWRFRDKIQYAINSKSVYWWLDFIKDFSDEEKIKLYDFILKYGEKHDFENPVIHWARKQKMKGK